MEERVDTQLVNILYRIQPVDPEEAERPQQAQVVSRHPALAGGAASKAAGDKGPAASGGSAIERGNATKGKITPGKVGRNDPCPCGSGKKHKRCCGA